MTDHEFENNLRYARYCGDLEGLMDCIFPHFTVLANPHKHDEWELVLAKDAITRIHGKFTKVKRDFHFNEVFGEE